MLLKSIFSVLALLTPVYGIWFNPTNATEVIAGANLLTGGITTYAPWWNNVSGATVGVFQQPYYWYFTGIANMALCDWAKISKNDSLNEFILQGQQVQSGQYWNYMTYNQTSVEGNDDQGFMGIAAMHLAERNFTRPSKGYPTWLYMAQATWNTMAARWETAECNGGLRWQIFTWNSGYDYKNMVANGCLFSLAARLARFTNNDTFVEWGEKIWNWASEVKFLNPYNPDAAWPNKQIRVIDGASTTSNCTNISPYEWTYDQGLMLAGCAYFYNYTSDPIWLDRLAGLWSRAEVFFADGRTVYEAACNPLNSKVITCTTDQRVFKGVFMQSLALVMQLVPQTKDWGMWNRSVYSAQNASWSCSGGKDGHTCGLSWIAEGWDGWYGLGEEISALDAFNTILIDQYPSPFRASDLPETYGTGDSSSSSSSGGSSSNSSSSSGGVVYGDGNAGLNSTTVSASELDLGTSDKAGAGVLTAVVGLFLIASSGWLVL